jgi:hypothetical protein
VARRNTALIVLGFAVFCLTLAYWWSIRIGLPLTGEKPWWYGKNAYVRMQVIEPGRDLATVSMRLPKGLLDTMVALETEAKISVGDLHVIRFRDIWKDLQRLPQGQKLKIEVEEATILVWIELGAPTGDKADDGDVGAAPESTAATP